VKSSMLRAGWFGLLLLSSRALLAQEVSAPISHLAIDPLDPSTLYAVAQVKAPRVVRGFQGVLPTPIFEELFRSDDAGNTWHSITTPSVDSPNGGQKYIAALAVDPQVSGTLYAATGSVFTDVGLVEASALFKSMDRGETWTKIFDESNDLNSIAIDPVASSTLYVGAFSAATPAGIFKSTDAGTSWSNVSPPGFDACEILGIDPSDPAVVYAGGCPTVGRSQTPLFRSSNGGTSWTATGAGLPTDSLPLLAFAIAPSLPTTIYAGSFDGVFRSVDSGAHWFSATFGPGSTTNLRALAVDPRSSSTAYAGAAAEPFIAQAGIFKTWDSGTSWWEPTDLENVAVNSIVIDPSSPDTVYLGTGNGVFKSMDAGGSWSPVDSGLPPAGPVRSVPATQPTPLHGRSL